MDTCREWKCFSTFSNWREQRTIYYEIGRQFAQKKFAVHFAKLLAEPLSKDKNRPIVFLGIGSDRITGDCLGPLIGYKLERLKEHKFLVAGTLKNPVHAINLQQTMEKLEEMRPKPVIVAIDASVGNTEHLGLITLSRGGLQPGLGVNKNLPRVGEIAITGIVTSEEEKEPFYLQQIPLSVVMEMADCVVQGIVSGLKIL